jgi:NifB/MoaA-like Fe-S oxidoreductase
MVLQPLLDQVGSNARVVVVENKYFGGNIGVSGLMVGEDIARTLADQPAGHRYLLPDVCLQSDRFLDGLTVTDLPRPVEVIGTDGVSLRQALGLDRLTPAFAGLGEVR